MKKLGKFFANVLIVAYAVIAIIVTILLLSYNEYHCSVLGGYTFILVTDDELEPEYPEGSLVLVKETKAKKVNVGDQIFLYRNISATQFEIKYAEVLMKDESQGENNIQFVLEGNTIIDSDDVIGTTKNIKVIPNLGSILSILESRYGYLFLIVVVSFVAFLYEIYELIMEIKYGDRVRNDDEYYYEDDDDEYDDDEEYEEEKPKKVAPKRKTATETAKKKTTTAKTTSTTKKKTTKASAKKTTSTPKKKATKE